MATKEGSVRLSATGGCKLRAELEGVGEAGARGFGLLLQGCECALSGICPIASRLVWRVMARPQRDVRA
jgi:hypothetical protein